MRDVTIDKNELLAIIIKNRDSHRDLFLKAQEGFKIEVVRLLDEQLRLARENKPVNLMLFKLADPQDHTSSYDRVIAMLKLSVHDNIVLTAAEFENYVMDKWNWSEFALSTNSTYAAQALHR